MLQLVSAIEDAYAPTIADDDFARGRRGQSVPIVTHCAARIADYKIPSRIELRDALPKSETGKLLRNQL